MRDHESGESSLPAGEVRGGDRVRHDAKIKETKSNTHASSSIDAVQAVESRGIDTKHRSKQQVVDDNKNTPLQTTMQLQPHQNYTTPKHKKVVQHVPGKARRPPYVHMKPDGCTTVHVSVNGIGPKKTQKSVKNRNRSGLV
jgi:hypothetical protein